MNDQVKAMEAMGLAMPSAWYFLGAIVFGIVGYMAWRRGRKIAQPHLTWTGLALMIYPYGVSETWMLWVIGMGLCAWVFMKWNPP